MLYNRIAKFYSEYLPSATFTKADLRDRNKMRHASNAVLYVLDNIGMYNTEYKHLDKLYGAIQKRINRSKADKRHEIMQFNCELSLF